MADGGFAAHLVERALAEQPGSATALRISDFWQQLTSLGSALAPCRSLTELDLSRNGLTSLQGLQTLAQLRKLNMYYNAITRVAELTRLSHHPNLSVLDMRLNPVTHNGRRYRLAVLGAAPSVRVLDERDVVGTERARAQIHHNNVEDDLLSGSDEDDDELSAGESDDAVSEMIEAQHPTLLMPAHGGEHVRVSTGHEAVAPEDEHANPTTMPVKAMLSNAKKETPHNMMVMSKENNPPHKASSTPAVLESKGQSAGINHASRTVAPMLKALAMRSNDHEENAHSPGLLSQDVKQDSRLQIAYTPAHCITDDKPFLGGIHIMDSHSMQQSLAQSKELESVTAPAYHLPAVTSESVSTPPARLSSPEDPPETVLTLVDQFVGHCADISPKHALPVPQLKAEVQTCKGSIVTPCHATPDTTPRVEGDHLHQTSFQDNTKQNVSLHSSSAAAAAATWSILEHPWAAEKRALEREVATLRREREEDAAVMAQTATLVGMLQEAHTALVQSNAQLLAELVELKERHAAEIEQFKFNFTEIQDELHRWQEQSARLKSESKSRGSVGRQRL